MSRGLRRYRPYAVWLGVTAAALAAAGTVPAAWRAADGASPSQGVAPVLVSGCAVALAGSLAWLWLVTTMAVAEIATGSAPRAGGAVRHLVLAACGVAVAAGTALPAQAVGGDGVDVLVGLSLPERAVGPAAVDTSRAPVAPVGGGTYVVRPGDSLWSIARAHPAPPSDVGARWRAIWRDNRDVVGDDPDLIHPGQALRLPGTDDQSIEQDDEKDDETNGERR